jgi:uncharacterized protein YjbI with pentapeptide repeats
LSGVNLVVEVYLSKGSLQGANVNNIDYRNANLYRTIFLDIEGSNLSLAMTFFAGTLLRHLNLIEVYFCGRDLQSASLVETTL